jgi:hypothetical protein
MARKQRFNEFDAFRLSKPLPDDDTIPVGTRGFVLTIYGGCPCAYEVEFPNGEAGNLGKESTDSITDDFMEPDSSARAD